MSIAVVVGGSGLAFVSWALLLLRLASRGLAFSLALPMVDFHVNLGEAVSFCTFSASCLLSSNNSASFFCV